MGLSHSQAEKLGQSERSENSQRLLDQGIAPGGMARVGQGGCPDGGACHHDCTGSCWRVSTCAPLGVSGWDDWPDEIKAANPPITRFENLLIEPPSRGQSGGR